MSQNTKSLQNVWQKRFRDLQLAYPFTADPKLRLRYQKLDTPDCWWHSTVNPNSLRLSKAAFSILEKQINVPKWKCELATNILPKTMIQLEKHFVNPYYIFNMKTLYVFDEKDFFVLTLHANDLQQYLDNQSL